MVQPAIAEPNLQAAAEEVLAELGWTPSQAVALFYDEVVRRRALPFPTAHRADRPAIPARDGGRPPPPLPEAQAGARFLAEASRLLADSLDYETTLATVTRLSLPYLGAWCIVDLCTDGQMRRAAVIHTEPAMQALARLLESGWPPERDDPLGVPRAIRTRATEVVAPVSDEMLLQVSHGDENLRILRALGMGSLLVVPLLARGDVLGAITYVSPSGGRAHEARDVALAEDLAARCAMALDNARLYREATEARAMAEEANRTKTQFLGTMSHELRTPLNAISAYVEIMLMGLRGPLTDRQREDLERIQVSHRHLVSLVEQVLDFARLGVGRMRYDVRPLPLPEVMRGVSAVIAPVADGKGVRFRVSDECAWEGLAVRADAEKLSQIVVNLLSNAVKFTPAGGLVELACDEADGQVRIEVRDTGVGIAPAEQERIFEPFVQVSHGLTRTAEGTGLGLTICRELARAMDGDVTVASSPGEGSVFTLTLPRADLSASPDAHAD
jgi:signal transduction histidine kinase